MPEPNRKLGPYTLVSRIGLGGFGVVWLAEKRTAIATTQFALKLPRGEDIDLEAFKQEAAIWLQASGHPNVLPLIDADIYDNQVAIVSEYVPDGSLASWLKQHGGKSPSPDAAVEMMDGVLAGLNHLHSRRIIHRDLKPENILLQRETPRLADFGIARLLKSSSHSAHVSGTLAYMAPEAFDGKRNEQTDVWSVGVIFYEMLAGRLPFDQPDIPSFIGAIMRYDPPPLPESVPDVLRLIVMKALQREPADRYASAAEMRQDLREAEHQLWLGGRKTVIEADKQTPPPVTPQPQLPQPTIRHLSVPPTTIRTAPPKTEPIIVPATPTLTAETLPKPIPVKRKSRSLAWLLGGGAVVVVLLLGTFSIIGVYYWRSSRRVANVAQPQTPSPSIAKQSPSIAKQSPEPDPLKQTLVGHTNQVNQVAYSPDGKTLASASLDHTVRLWDAQSGGLKQILRGHTEDVDSVAFSPDGQTLASVASFDGIVKLWDAQTGALKQTLKDPNRSANMVAFSPDGKTLATGSYDGTVKLRNAQTGALKQTLREHNGTVIAVAFSPDGNTLASVSSLGEIKLWDGQTGALKQTLPGGSTYGISVSVSFSPDGKILASTSSSERMIKFWDAQTGTLKQTLTGYSDRVYSATFSPDGKTLASASSDGTIKFWEAQTGALKQTLTGHKEYVICVAFSPDGRTLASGSGDNTVKLWTVLGSE